MQARAGNPTRNVYSFPSREIQQHPGVLHDALEHPSLLQLDVQHYKRRLMLLMDVLWQQTCGCRCEVPRTHLMLGLCHRMAP